MKKKSKQTLISSEDMNKRESQQQRILAAAYLLEGPAEDLLRPKNKHIATTHYVIYSEVDPYSFVT